MYIKFETDTSRTYEIDLEQRTFSVDGGRWREFQQVFSFEQGMHLRFTFLTYHQHHVTDPVFHVQEGYMESKDLLWKDMIFKP